MRWRFGTCQDETRRVSSVRQVNVWAYPNGETPGIHLRLCWLKRAGPASSVRSLAVADSKNGILLDQIGIGPNSPP